MRNKNRFRFICLLFLGLSLQGQNAFGLPIMLSIEPSTIDISIGDIVSFDVKISGLEGDAFDPNAPSLSTYDLDVLFDSTILTYRDTTFGDPVLGNQLDLFGFGSIQSAADLGTLANVFELSLDLPFDLVDFQAGFFTLFTIDFDATAAGTSDASLSVLALGDEWGDPLDASVTNARIEVKATSVPEPSILLLFVLGLVGLGFGRKVSRVIKTQE